MNNAGLRNRGSSQQQISDREELLNEAKIKISKAKENVEKIWDVKAKADIQSHEKPSKQNDVEKSRTSNLLKQAIKAEIDAIKEQFQIEEELTILQAGGSITSAAVNRSVRFIVSDAVGGIRSAISGWLENDVEARYITTIIYDNAEVIDNLLRSKDTQLSRDIRGIAFSNILKDNTQNIEYLFQINFSFKAIIPTVLMLIKLMNNMMSDSFGAGGDDGGYGGNSNLIDVEPSNNGETITLLLGNITDVYY